mgnify:CR=1 FL=1
MTATLECPRCGDDITVDYIVNDGISVFVEAIADGCNCAPEVKIRRLFQKIIERSL